MATPRFVKFSPICRRVDDVLKRLEETIFTANELEYDRFAALRPDDDPYTGGLTLAQDMVACHSRRELMTLANGWDAWAISYLARRVPGNINLYLLGSDGERWTAAVSFDTSMLTFVTEDLAPGEWFRWLLVSFVEALGCGVCGYGADNAYRIRYEPLVTAVVLERLRAGDLFLMAFPNFHAISIDLIGLKEMQSLLAVLPRDEFLDYRVTTGGYHVLSILP